MQSLAHGAEYQNNDDTSFGGCRSAWGREGKDTLCPRPRFLLQSNGCSSRRKALCPRPKFARHTLPSPMRHEPSHRPERGPPATCPPLHCRPSAHTYPHRAAPCQFCAKGPWLDRSLENLLFSSEEAGWGWLGSLQGPTSFLFLNSLSQGPPSPPLGSHCLLPLLLQRGHTNLLRTRRLTTKLGAHPQFVSSPGK